VSLHPPIPSSSANAFAPTILVAGDSPDHPVLIRALEHEGYRVEHASTGQSLVARVLEAAASLVILDDGGGGRTAAAWCADLRQDAGLHVIPVIVLVHQTNWDNRSAALDAGADAVFSASPDHNRLLHRIEDLIGGAVESEAPAVLALGDDRRFLDDITDALQRARVQTLTCMDPREIFSTLGSTIPDALVIGSRCGQVNGLDLYFALKRQDGLDHAPALFVTDNGSDAERLVALRLGFDDYITRSDRHELPRRVLTRVSRSRFYKHIANRDPLTGVLNYRAFIDRLTHELDRAARYDFPFTLVLLDLDRFKQLNDRFGHLAGNRALQELVFFLRRKVRKSDLIARVGGDEFAVLMIQAPKNAVVPKWEGLWEMFRTTPIPVSKDGSSTYLEFSFGMASWPQDGDAVEELIATADTNLYRFKARPHSKLADAA
jgi:diguanylate cyclase (GGDEF)-like protein